MGARILSTSGKGQEQAEKLLKRGVEIHAHSVFVSHFHLQNHVADYNRGHKL